MPIVARRLHVWTGLVTVQSHAQVTRGGASSARSARLHTDPAQSSSPYWAIRGSVSPGQPYRSTKISIWPQKEGEMAC